MCINPLATPWVMVYFSVTRGAICPLAPAHRTTKIKKLCTLELRILFPFSLPSNVLSRKLSLTGYWHTASATSFKAAGEDRTGSCVSKHHGVTQFVIPQRCARCRKLRSLNEEWQSCPRRPSVVNLSHGCVPSRLREADRQGKNNFTPVL